MLDIADLPQPSEAFDWVQAAAGPALVCRPLARVASHLFTTRHWRLGSATDADDPAAWEEVARTMHVDPSRLVRVRQVHGASAAIAAGDSGHQAQADIIVSGDPALALAVQTADCIPLLMADRRTGAVAAAHAGWRGLSARAPEAAVATLAREYGSRSADLVAAIGPAIGACCYEVGAEVRERFAAAGCSGDHVTRWFLTVPPSSVRNPSISRARGARAPDRWFFEISATAREQLMEAGVRDDQIFVAGLCTASHPDVFCSYRRDGQSAGRTAGAIRSAPPRP